MKVNDLIESVSAAWNFFVPPARQLFGLLLIARVVFGKEHFYALLPSANLAPSEGFKRAAEFYGLDKLMPLIALFCALLFLHAFRTVMQALINNLPPNFITLNRELVQTVFARTVAFVWACSPEIEQYGAVQSVIGEILRKAEADKSYIYQTEVDHQVKRSNRMYGTFAFLKVAFYWTLIVIFWAAHRHVPGVLVRSVFVLAFVITAWLASLAALVQQNEQRVAAEFHAAETLLKQNATTKLPGNDELDIKQAQITRDYTGKRWWRLEVSVFRPIAMWNSRLKQRRWRLQEAQRARYDHHETR